HRDGGSMRSPIDRMAAFADDLIHNRRPRRFKASSEDAQALQGAALIRSAQPGADLPDSDFIERLGRQLRSQMDPPRVQQPVSRRVLLRTAGLAAAAGVAGAVIERTIAAQPLGQQAALMPDHGTWRAVAAVADVPAGHAVRFSSGPVEGVVVNERGAMKAGTSVCPPQGCLLLLDAAGHRLRCPCPPTVFSESGRLASFPLPTRRDNLPLLQARVRDGN